jgi:hypothetical protein
LRIAKNFVLQRPVADERSDAEDEEDDLDRVEDSKDVKMNGTKPVVLINGVPLEGESTAQRVRKRNG